MPLPDRLCGKDKDIKGFRYYLPCPYLVVPQRIDVDEQRTPAVVVEDLANPVSAVYLSGLDEHGQPALYNLAGNPVPVPPLCQLAAVSRTTRELSMPRKVEEPTKQVPRNVSKFKGLKSLTSLAAVLRSAAGTNGNKSSNSPTSPPHSLVPGESSKTAPVAVAEERPSAVSQLRIVYLPDFEQQMAVRPCNFLAKNEFSLAFHDGWQLTSVNAVCDATDVPTHMLDTLRKLMVPTTAAANAGANIKAPLNLSSSSIQVCICRTCYLAPGIYRLNKPVPTHDGAPPCVALLNSLGVPLECETVVHVLP